MDFYANIDQAAHESAYGHNLSPTPSVAQQDSGNYRKGRTSVGGIPVVIENPRGSQREWRAADGTSGMNLMKFHYGYIDGVTGADGDELDCYVGPYPESTKAYVVNQTVGGKFDEHKVMLGFPDQRTAEAGYLSNFDAGWPGLGSCVPCSLSQLRWWMANGKLSSPLTEDQLPYEEKNPMQKVLWDSANQPRGKTIDQVLYDVRAHDGADGLIFDPVCVADILADADGVVTLDALVVPYAKLPRSMAILQRVMNRKGGDLSVMNVQISDPFTQKGTTNVAAVFELSDGQTISIFFHNPDVTPKKIMASDEVVSWKWLLNKKDVTIVVAPERGRDLNIQNVAARVMTLAARNSSRFAQTNAKRADRMASIANLQKQHADGEATLAALHTEITELESAVALKKVTPVVKEPDQITPVVIDVTDPAASTDANPDDAPPNPVELRAAWIAKMEANDTPSITIDGSEYFVLGYGAKGEPGSDHDGQVFAHLASKSSGAVQANGWYPSQISDWIPDPAAPVEPQPVIEPTPEPDVAVEPTLQPDSEPIVDPTTDPTPDREPALPDPGPTPLPLPDMHVEAPPEPQPEPVEATIDPMTPDGYATVMASPDLQLQYQDALDAFFQERIVAVRNALRELGWESRDAADARLYKNDSEVQPTFVHVGAGNNVIGFAMNGIADDLSKTPDQFAAEVDTDAMAESARRAQVAAAAPSLDELVSQAAALGAQAFADGKESTPALNADLTPLIAAAGDGAAAVIQAYADAWHAANAAAPVVGVTDVVADTTAVDDESSAAAAGATQEQAVTALKALRPFIPTSQMRAISDAMRGEEKQAFFDKVVEMAAIIDSMPVSYETDGQGNDAVARLHYFRGGSDWYITEKDRDGDGTQQAFGFAVLNGDLTMAQLGYISIAELVSAGVELDLYWTPQTLAKIRHTGDDVTDVPANVDRSADGITNVEAVTNELGGSLGAWEPSGENWRYADLTVGEASVRVGVSTGGVVSVNGHPFTPDDEMNLTLDTVRAAILAALPVPEQVPEVAVEVQPAAPLSDDTMQKYIVVAADSIEKLRRIDVYRVLDALPADNPDGVTRSALASWIVAKRPDLAAEVTSVMAEEYASDGWTPPAADRVADVAAPLPEVITEVPPVEPAPNPDRTNDLDFLKAVAGGSIDMMADGIAERIEQMVGKYSGDAEIETAVRDAVSAYTDYMTKAIAG